ncbi:hypothetical protein D3C72_1236170 [compost metagenome]
MADAACLEAALRDALGVRRAAPGVVIGGVAVGIGLHRAQGVGHLAESVQHRLLVGGGRRFVGRFGGTLARSQFTPAKQRLHQPQPQAPHVHAVGQIPRARALRAKAGRQRELRVLVGGGHAHVGGRLMPQRLGGQDVRALARQRGRHAGGNVGGQGQVGQAQGRRAQRGGRQAQIYRQLMRGLRQLFFQRRQRGAGLRHQQFLIAQVGLCDAARRHALPHDVLLAHLRGQQVAGGGQPFGQVGLADGGRDHIGGQRHARGLQFVRLIIHLRRHAFQRPSVAAEHVQRVGHIDRGVV